MPSVEQLKWALRYAEKERKAYELRCGELQSEMDRLQYEMDSLLAMSPEDLKEYKKSAFYLNEVQKRREIEARLNESRKDFERLLTLTKR